MDNQIILVIVLLCVNILSNLFNNGLMTFQTCMKLLKRSTCCGSIIEFRDKTPPNSPSEPHELTKKNNEQFDLIVEKIRKSVENI